MLLSYKHAVDSKDVEKSSSNALPFFKNSFVGKFHDIVSVF